MKLQNNGHVHFAKFPDSGFRRIFADKKKTNKET